MINVGTVLYGFCNGFFGRDSYGKKRIEAIGADWVVVREEGGQPNFASFAEGWEKKDIQELLEEWSNPIVVEI